MGRCYGHGGIVTKSEPLTIVHAFAGARCVVEEEVRRSYELDERLKTAKYASYWAEERVNPNGLSSAQ